MSGNQESFLERTICWMTHDVGVCMAHDANVGAMTLMLTDVAALAGFYAGRTEKNPRNDHDEFTRFFIEFFDLAKDKEYADLIFRLTGAEKRCVIYDDFRCGLVHEHLMKNGAAIDKGYAKPYIFYSLEGFTLNLDLFYADYLNALSQYSDKVRNDKGVAKNFKARAQFLGAYEPYI